MSGFNIAALIGSAGPAPVNFADVADGLFDYFRKFRVRGKTLCGKIFTLARNYLAVDEARQSQYGFGENGADRQAGDLLAEQGQRASVNLPTGMRSD